MPNDLVSFAQESHPLSQLPERAGNSERDQLAKTGYYQQPADPHRLAEKISRLRQITAKFDNLAQSVPMEYDQSLFRINYAEALNHGQLQAVLTIRGPVLVIAGAGTGKTHLVVHRVSYLIEKDVVPMRILLLTFTRKAAREMMSRVNQLLGSTSGNKVNGGTFHSFSTHALRKFGNLLGCDPKFTIIDEADASDVVDIVRSEFKYGESDKEFPKKDRIYTIISSSRNRSLTIGEVINREYSGLEKHKEAIEAIYSGYRAYKKESRLFDFDDLMEVLRDGLRDNAAFRGKMQDYFDYILVDEYQDTNIIQKEIVDLLAAKHRNIMVVGDDAQSIYSFRGANYENILRFPETYEDCRVIKLEENYRSHQGLLDFTNGLIDKAAIGFKKRLFSHRAVVNRPIIAKFYDKDEEAQAIVTGVLKLRENGFNLNQMAVLCRSSYHWLSIEKELITRRIPYVTVGGVKFNEKAHIKDVLAYLRVAYNPYDTIAWQRLLRLLPGIGKINAAKLVTMIQANQGRLRTEDFESRKFYDDLKNLSAYLGKAVAQGNNISLMIQAVLGHYYPILKIRADDYEVRMLDLDVLIDFAQGYTGLEQFLTDFALDPPSKKFGEFTPKKDESEEPPLTLSTIHSAKGLEWACVFIPSALDGMIPSNRSFHSTEELEEERRLLYVACTRAKEYLFITMPSLLGTYSGFFSLPSRFLTNLDNHLYRYLTTVNETDSEPDESELPHKQGGFFLSFE